MPLTPAQRTARYEARKRGEFVPELPMGVPKGYKQSPEHVAKRFKNMKRGEQHPLWRGDAVTENIGRRIARKLYKADHCETCGAKNNLDRHHKDGNPVNNSPENVQVLCRLCHMKEDGRLAELHKNGVGARWKK